MRHAPETVEGSMIAVWELGRGTLNRYTVAFMDTETRGQVDYLELSTRPYGRAGFRHAGSIWTRRLARRRFGGWYRRQVPFAAMPYPCRLAVLRHIRKAACGRA